MSQFRGLMVEGDRADRFPAMMADRSAEEGWSDEVGGSTPTPCTSWRRCGRPGLAEQERARSLTGLGMRW
ncbi:hypothetical protein [Embleya sp. NPDC020630]|uniref:hypothetical protein n=1 Tax=Embleya sp. NPDC020630 TaxID=3363979 RepID=UPI00379FB9D6